MNAFTLQMALRTRQMAKEIPQDVLLSPHIDIYESMCVHKTAVSWGDTSVKAFGVSPLWTISHCPILQQERSSQGRVAERDSGSTCLFTGLPTHLWYAFGQASLFLFIPLPYSVLYFNSRSSGWRFFQSLAVKTCTMLVLFCIFCFPGSVRDTALCSIFCISQSWA